MNYILFHSNCFDGFGAAWAAKQFFKYSAKYIPVSYQFDPPKLKPNANVYLVDFSYPLETLKTIAETANKVVVLDHHKSSQEALKELPLPDTNEKITALFDMNRSGAVITWEFFHPDKNTPLFLQYIQDRDLWRFELPKSEEFHAWLRSHPFDYELWDKFNLHFEHNNQGHFLREGEALLRATNQTVAMMCKKARYVNILNHKAVIVNATCHWSEVGHHLLAEHPEAEFAASYGDVTENKVMWSLRSRGDFDVSQIAKVFGGGGHKAAAGCANLEYEVI